MQPDFTDGLLGALRHQAGALWQGYVKHDFVDQLAAGTLSAKSFKRFLTQDYLFLIHFARAYALLAAKSTKIADINDALSGLQAIAGELPLHVGYCADWGIDEKSMQEEIEASQTIAYTRYVLDIGHIGDRLDLMAALMPCVVGYAEIGLRIARDPKTNFKTNPYGAWIKNYESGEYLKGVQAGIDMMNRLGADYNGKARFSQLSTIFNMATRLETDFWQMGLDA